MCFFSPVLENFRKKVCHLLSCAYTVLLERADFVTGGNFFIRQFLELCRFLRSSVNEATLQIGIFEVKFKRKFEVNLKRKFAPFSGSAPNYKRLLRWEQRCSYKAFT